MAYMARRFAVIPTQPKARKRERERDERLRKVQYSFVAVFAFQLIEDQYLAGQPYTALVSSETAECHASLAESKASWIRP